MTQDERAGRTRIALLATAFLAAVLAAVLALTLGGASVAPPQTGAASVVPADALAYVNLSLDRRRPPVGDALRLARTFDGFSAALDAAESRLGLIAGTSTFADAVRPWVGGEAALALLRAPGNRARALVVLSVRNPRAFHRFLAGADRSGVAAVGSYAVFGDRVGLAVAAGVARGARPSLAADAGFQRASAGEPADRVLDAYLPASGLVSLLAGRGGLLGGAGALLDSPGLQAVSLSLSPAAGGAHIRIHSVFAGREGSAPAGVPTLQGELPSGAAVMIDVPDLARAAPRLLAAGSVAGVGGQIGPLLTRLGAALHSEGVDVHRLVGMFAHEGAVAITSLTQHPSLLVLARAPRPDVARVRLADLEPPLASLFPPASSGPGAAPVFGTSTVAGVQVHTLQLAPGLQFDYAVFGHLIALATSSDAIDSVVSRAGSLGDSPGFRAVLGTPQDGGTSLVFANPTELIRLGEQTGLLRGAVIGALAGDLTRITAIGLRSTGGRDESTAELNLSIP